LKKFTVTDIIGQPHVFTVYAEETVDGKKVPKPYTVRLRSRESVEIEADTLPEEVAQEEKLGFVFVEKQELEQSAEKSYYINEKKDEVN
jgi:hypothetical protein